MSRFVKSRHEYRLDKATGRDQRERCRIHNEDYYAYGRDGQGRWVRKNCPSCDGEARVWNRARTELGATATEKEVYKRAKEMAGVSLQRYLHYDR